MNFRDELVPIGKIVNTFSMNGTVKLLLNDGVSFNQTKINDSKNKVLFFQDSQKVFQPLEITKIVNNEGNLLLINFNGYDSISAAEKLKNFKLFADKNNELFTKAPNYLEFSFNYGTNNTQVIDVMTNGQYLLFKISVDGKEIWVPEVEEYIDNIDIKNKEIHAKNIERLI